MRERLRLLYKLDDQALAPAPLDAWLAWASRSRLRPFSWLARTLRQRRRDPRRTRLGVTNGRLEGLDSKIRPVSRRSFGFRSPDPLIGLVYLCCTGLDHRAAAMNFTQLGRSARFCLNASVSADADETPAGGDEEKSDGGATRARFVQRLRSSATGRPACS